MYIRAVYIEVRFIWDPDKSERNLAERGFDFAFASLAFEGRTLERIDTRQDYGEVRRIALGIADGIPRPSSTPTGQRLARSFDGSFPPE
jgi:hypothetical protein